MKWLKRIAAAAVLGLATFGAFSKCSNRDGYTMGYSESAYRQSFLDLWQFLRRTWQLDGPAITELRRP